ncbi:MAG TPA: DEAD/DEAH box helicase [bacterium]|nr:DEAD/DEAH box helicase [bacterium]
MNDFKTDWPEMTLEQLPPALQDAAARAGWTSLMPVQAKAIPGLLSGRNMMIQARTGSGKTGAFLLPMMEQLNPKKPGVQALVLVPTRELAKQVWREAAIICGGAGFRTVAVYGGVGYGTQKDAIRQGAHIVVGTPGRVLDHLRRGTLSLKELTLLIFDEADRMLSMGFYPDMKQIQKHLPKRKLHGCMFSATFPATVMHTAREFIHDPEFLSLSKDHVHVTDTTHIYYTVPDMDKDRSLIRVIEVENPASALIFCNTKSEVHYVTAVLQQFGYDADELSADLSQKDRERVLERVRRGTLRFLVATDVAARGLDIPELTHVFQYEVPEDTESYIHRAGRTGRAGAAGIAITLVTRLEQMTLRRIAKHYGIDLEEWLLPSNEDVQTVVEDRMIALLEARLRDRDPLKAERSRRFIHLGRSLAESEEESAIIAMLLDDAYQQALHAPPPVPLNEPEKKKPESTGGKERGRSRPRKRRRT